MLAQDIEDIAILVDGTPQVMSVASDGSLPGAAQSGLSPHG